MAVVDLSANAQIARDRIDLDEVLRELDDAGRLVHVERFPERHARFATLAEPLPDALAASVDKAPLYTHQAEAIDHIRAGRSVVVATGTGSGKSRCYQLPIAEAAGRRPARRPGTALLLFPTKALAQDQLRSFLKADYAGVTAGTYDGDSTPEERTWVKNRANVVLTNPEMLHNGILPSHSRWSRFLGRLEHVVIDELHVLRGVFGTHVAHVLRRLRRLCAHYGSDPTFVFTSATIGAPETLASRLCGLPIEAVTADGSPQAERLLALVNPEVLDEAMGLRASANSESASVASSLIRGGHRTIVFTRSRKGAELVTADIGRTVPDAADAVCAYRAGYLPAERREIEQRLFSGELRGVVATSALELGIDVGDLDACVLNGFPGTVASMWQQIGRAGRGAERSLAVLVAGEDQLDQWIMNHPVDMLSRSPEPAVINPDNPFILGPHLTCAAHELPLSHDDDQWWGDALDDGIRDLVIAERLTLKPSGSGAPVAVPAIAGRPSRSIGLRSGSTDEIQIVDLDGEAIGTVDASRAPSVVHEGAIYLHRGTNWRVESLDLHDRQAIVVESDGEHYTQARTSVDISVVHENSSATFGPIEVHVGDVEVTSRVTGYTRREVRSKRILAHESLDLPPSTLRTRSFWWTIPADVLDAAKVSPSDAAGTLHAAEHAAIGMLPLFAICDRWDVGGVSTPWHSAAGGPAIFIYDAHPGGSGVAELGYQEHERLLRATRDAVRACACATGCPSCVQSPKCGNGNEPLDKAGAVALLSTILGSEPPG